MQAANCCCRGAITAVAAADGHLHIHECTLRRSAAPPTARTARPDAARSQITLGTLVIACYVAHDWLGSLILILFYRNGPNVATVHLHYRDFF